MASGTTENGSAGIGVAYADGGQFGKTVPMPTMASVKDHVAKLFGPGFKPVIWLQDGAMILSED